MSPVFEALTLSCFVKLMGTLRFAHPVLTTDHCPLTTWVAGGHPALGRKSERALKSIFASLSVALCLCAGCWFPLQIVKIDGVFVSGLRLGSASHTFLWGRKTRIAQRIILLRYCLVWRCGVYI